VEDIAIREVRASGASFVNAVVDRIGSDKEPAP